MGEETTLKNEESKRENDSSKKSSTIAVPKYLVLISIILMGALLIFGLSLAFGRSLGLRFDRRQAPYAERFDTMMGRRGFRDGSRVYPKDGFGQGRYCPGYDDAETKKPESGDFVCPNCSNQN